MLPLAGPATPERLPLQQGLGLPLLCSKPSMRAAQVFYAASLSAEVLEGSVVSPASEDSLSNRSSSADLLPEHY